MFELNKIEGEVIENNTLLHNGKKVDCWTTSVQSPVVPRPLNLSPHLGKVISLKGIFHHDLWNASFERVISETAYKKITGNTINFDEIEGPDGNIKCYRNGRSDESLIALNLCRYLGKTITVAGDLHEKILYKTSVVKVPGADFNNDPGTEARSLNDLFCIRAANRDKISAVKGNLGTALGYKWTNGVKTDQPCIVFFVPRKVPSWLIPEEEKVPVFFMAENGLWCLTDVVTGGRDDLLENNEPLPKLSHDNKFVTEELRYGQIGLIGGIQLAFFAEGIEDASHASVGTAGIAVRHKRTGRIGFITDKQVAGSRGRKIYHPWHFKFSIGETYLTKEHAADEMWYGGVIDEEFSIMRCDCGFVTVDEHLIPYIKPGLHAIGRVGQILHTYLDDMNIIGQKVISVGRTRGVQRGTVAAYAYEYSDGSLTVFTDFLIKGEEGTAFSAKGDRGKIIVTDDDLHRPVAMLWGDWQVRIHQNREQENWIYASDLRKLFDVLDLELLV